MASRSGSMAASGLSSGALGPVFVAIAGLGFLGYGVILIVLNFTTFLELGLTAQEVGVTRAEIQGFSMDLYHYISHVQLALGAFIVGLGLSVTALAWFSIRARLKWAFWTALIAPAAAIIIALPSHYFWGFDTLGHLGLVYLDLLIWLVGMALSYRWLRSAA